MTTRAHRRGFFAAMALVACLGGAAAPAEAAEPGPDTLPISVIAVQTPDADDQAEALTKALRFAVKGMPGWSMAEGDYSLEVLTISLKCVEPPDATCQSRIADQIKADRYVWGIVKKKGAAEVTGDLFMWVRGQGTKKTSVTYSANLTEANDEALRKIARDALAELTGGPPKGTVHVKVGGDVEGQVFIDGQPAGALVNGEGTFPAPAGDHKIVVKAPGYSSVESPVTVKPAATAEVVLTMVPLDKGTPINWKRIGGFAGIGAGVAFGVVGVVSTVRIGGLQKELDDRYLGIAPYTTQEDVCSFAESDADPLRKDQNADIKRICGDGSTFQVLQFIMYPLAAISAGAGVYLLMTSGGGASAEAPKTGWTITPKVGMESGKIDLTYRW
jgi:hypothetical protein